MSLSDLASLGSFISAIAVLISLVYLSLQVRQAEKNQRALMQQGRADRISDNCLRMADAGLSHIYARGVAGDETMSPEEIDQFMMIMRGALVSAEDSFLQHHSGQLDEMAFRSYTAGLRSMFAVRPGSRAAWRLSSAQYGGEFQQFIDGILVEIPVSQPRDVHASWCDAVKTEKPGAPGSPSA